MPASGSNFNSPPNFGELILKIFNVFIRLKLSPSMDVNKIDHFSKISFLRDYQKICTLFDLGTNIDIVFNVLMDQIMIKT